MEGKTFVGFPSILTDPEITLRIKVLWNKQFTHEQLNIH